MYEERLKRLGLTDLKTRRVSRDLRDHMKVRVTSSLNCMA